MLPPIVRIGGRAIGGDEPTFVVAEMSANHDRSLEQALSLVDLAAAAGVHAVKLQTYSADSLTLRTSHPSARVDPVWGAETLHDLYERAAMPHEFHGPLFERARERGLVAFSSVFDPRDVDLLERFDVPAFKIASPELVHFPLLRRVGATGRPVVVSTGMATLGEVEEAVEVLAGAGAREIVLLHCCSAYPAEPAAVNLAVMRTLRQVFGCPVGFSDHTVGIAVPIAAAALGAALVEKHFTNDPGRQGPDHRFSLPAEDLRRMVDGIRQAGLARGTGRKHVTAGEASNRLVGRPSIFAVTTIPAGTVLTSDKIRVARPGAGLHPKFFEGLVGRIARRDIPKGWPITWDDV